jgi:hypothetical protein
MTATRERIKAKYEAALHRIRSFHVKGFPGHPDPVFLISDTYPGVWLEHVYDAISWARFDPSMAAVARSQTELFLDNRREDGQLPCLVLDSSNPNSRKNGSTMGFGQLQECVSFAGLCLQAFQLTRDGAYLVKAYDGCSRWDSWLEANRMTRKMGLVECFCGYDTGHDNSPRFDGKARNGCPDGDARKCAPEDYMPMLSPDLNAVLYGSRRALAEMADLLGRGAESAAWTAKAAAVKQALMDTCYDPRDGFFYDVDRHGSFRKFRSIQIAGLFQEHVLDGQLAEEVYTRYLRNPKEFWTPYPFPSLSISDPAFREDLEGNDWGFFSQGLTALRTLLWMDHYGKGKDMEILMAAWVDRLAASEGLQFTQELHPLTGLMTRSSEWYSSAMLFYLHSVRRLGLLE